MEAKSPRGLCTLKEDAFSLLPLTPGSTHNSCHPSACSDPTPISASVIGSDKATLVHYNLSPLVTSAQS